MRISRIKLNNWRNFPDAEAGDLSEVVYLLGQNVSGKSNFLDSMRFLQELAKPMGGGLQEAVEGRGGITKIRCMHARNDEEVSIDVDLADDEGRRRWNYVLGFNVPNVAGKQCRQSVIAKEIVHRFADTGEEKSILERPNIEGNYSGPPNR